MKLREQQLDASCEAKRVALDVLDRARQRPNFGNGGDVENLLSRAKTRYQQRQSAKPANERESEITFIEEDFDPELNRMSNLNKIRQEMFSDVVGCEKVKSQLEGYQRMAAGMRLRGIEPGHHIPTTFIFKGPPGTGKTTTARKIGQIFYDMGSLSTAEVVETSASDLVGEYAGGSGPKTKRLLESALGKVLFIDEAYRLGGSRWEASAVDELVDCLTKTQFIGKIVVVLAGYENEMNSLLATNPGLRSRFPTEIAFDHLPAKQCLRLLKIRIEAFNIGVTETDTRIAQTTIVDLFEQLKQLPSWGNGRDITTLARNITGEVFKSLALSGDATSDLTVSAREIIHSLNDMLRERKKSSIAATRGFYGGQDLYS